MPQLRRSVSMVKRRVILSPSPSHSPSSSTNSFSFPSSSSNEQVLSLSSTTASSSHSSDSSSLVPPSDKEVNNFFASLASLSAKPAILILIEPHSSNCIPKSMSEDLPMCLLNLLKPKYLSYSYGELLTLAKQCKISVTPEQVQAVERKT